MLYRQFGCTGLKLSAIGVGYRNVGSQWGIISESTAEGIVKAAYSSGINLFDATEDYGDMVGVNEVRLRKALQGIRSKVYIAAKLKPLPESMDKKYLISEGLVRTSFRLTASRLNTEYIDILLCDSSSGDLNGEYIGELNLLKKEGLITTYGISTSDIGELRRFYELSEGNCGAVQLEYSMLNKSAELELLPFCREKGLGVLVKRPLAKGLLSGRFNKTTVFRDLSRIGWNVDGVERESFERNLEKVNSIRLLLDDASDMTTMALRYVLSNEAAPIAVPGVTAPEQILINARAGLRLLTADEKKALKAVL